MRRPIVIALAATLLTPFSHAKSNKSTVPQAFLTARTAAVMIDPDAGFSLDDPRANQVAQKDVEAALLKWGRFVPTLNVDQADLIIVIHKGTGKLADPTITDSRPNNRPGAINTTDDAISIGVQHGNQTGGPPTPPPSSSPGPPHSQVDTAAAQDSFAVYEGKVEHPLDRTPGWQYNAKDALHSHDVPVVDKFKKAIEEAEKAAAKNPPPGNTPAKSPANAPNNP